MPVEAFFFLLLLYPRATPPGAEAELQGQSIHCVAKHCACANTDKQKGKFTSHCWQNMTCFL